MMAYLLYLLILLPAVFGLCFLSLPIKRDYNNPILISTTAVGFAISLFIFSGFYLSPTAGITISAQSLLFVHDLDQYLLNFYVDRLSALFLLLSSALFLVAVVSMRSLTDLGRVKRGAVLILQSALFGLFLSKDLLSYVFFCALLLIPAIMFFDFQQKEADLRGVQKYILGRSLSVFFLILVLIGEKANSTGVLREWLYLDWGLDEIRAHSILFFILCIALFIRLPIFPFQYYFRETFQTKRPELILFFGVLSSDALYGFFRFGLGIYGGEINYFAPVLISLLILSMFLLLIWTLRDFSNRSRLSCSNAFWSNFVVLSLFVLTADARMAAVFSLIFQMLLLTIQVPLCALKERNAWNFEFSKIKKYPIFSALYLWINSANYFLPVSLGFYCAYLLANGILSSSVSAYAVVFVVVPIAFYILYKALTQKALKLDPANKAADEHKPVDLDMRDLSVFVLPILLLLLLGIYPDIFFDYTKLLIEEIFSGIRGA